ncbi:MAG: hypothetical protein KJ587_02730 [Alphaproteobacteria bacterium]|nr:hypothetical protein [Alphaproteobacteria bacterium]
MSAAWARIGGFARKAVALGVAGAGLWVTQEILIDILFDRNYRWLKPTEPVLLLTGVTLLITGVALWMWPRLRRWLAASVAALPVAPVIGTAIGTWLYQPGSELKEFILEPLHQGDPAYFSALVVAWVVALWVLLHRPKLAVTASPKTDAIVSREDASPSPDGVASQVAEAPQTKPPASLLSQINFLRGSISRGSYVAAALWFFALIFAAIDSGAFSSHALSFIIYLLLPIAFLFFTDWWVGKRRSPA